MRFGRAEGLLLRLFDQNVTGVTGPAYRDRNCGGLLAENPERTVAQPVGIALAILGKLYDCLRDRRR